MNPHSWLTMTAWHQLCNNLKNKCLYLMDPIVLLTENCNKPKSQHGIPEHVGQHVGVVDISFKQWCVRCNMCQSCPLIHINTLRLRQNGCLFADDKFKCISNENVWFSIKISLKFVPKGPITNIPALVHIKARRRAGNKLSSESAMVRLLVQICVTRPDWKIVLVEKRNQNVRFFNPMKQSDAYMRQ